MRKIIDDDLLAFMGEQESQYLIKPSELYEQVLKRIEHDETTVGLNLPWQKTNPFIKLRAGETSLWCGISGHGKSTMLSQICAWGLQEKWLIASMEMQPEATMERMVKQIAGTDNPSSNYLRRVLDWTDNKLWIYDQTDTVKSERILALVRYAKTLGINHVVIDSLMKCGIGKENLEGQAQFVDRLCWAAKANNLHIHLVHHMRKGESEYKIPGKFDVRGAGEIVDQIDNLFIIHRNKTKEEDTTGKHDDDYDAYLKCAKQRHFSWEGLFGFWYDKLSNQYTTKPNHIMTHWLNTDGLQNQLAAAK